MDRKHILCVCEFGNNRSVTMAWLLKHVSNFETLACGLNYHTIETKKMLFEWADVIVVPQQELLAFIPEEHKHKIKFYNIGEDIYPRPHNPELLRKAKKLMDEDHIL